MQFVDHPGSLTHYPYMHSVIHDSRYGTCTYKMSIGFVQFNTIESKMFTSCLHGDTR